MANFVTKDYLLTQLKNEKSVILDAAYLGKTAKAVSAGTADSATKATQDGSGNTITSTYATKTELGNKVDKVSGKELVSTTDIAQITTNKNDIASLNNDVDELENKLDETVISSESSGNPLKLTSTDAPLIDFKVDGFTQKFNQLAKDATWNVSANTNDTKTIAYIGVKKGSKYLIRLYQVNDLSSVTRNTLSVYGATNEYQSTSINNHLGKGFHNFIYTANEDRNVNIVHWCHTPNADVTYSMPQIFDLTEMFGSGNEPTVEEFERMFPNSYYPYDSGSIKALGDQWGVVDLGDCDWSSVFSAQDGRFITSNLSQNIKPITDESISPSFHCESYDNFAYENRNSYTIGISQDTQGRVIVKDPDFISKDASYVKNKLKGKLLFFELADNATPSMYAVRVDECGKNLWDDSKANHNYYDYTNGNRAVYDSYLSMGYDLIPLKLGESITISYKSNLNIWGAFVVFNKDGIYKGQVSGFMDNEKKMTYTADDDVLVSPQLYRNPTITIGVDLFDIQLEKNTMSTEYIPYEGKSVFIPTTSPLQEGDSISYHVDGSGVEHRKKIVLDLGDLSWFSVGTNDYAATLPFVMKRPSSANDVADIVSSDFNVKSQVSFESENNSIAYFYTSSLENKSMILFYKNDISGSSNIKEYCKGKYAVFGLATPTDTPLTADQVAELKKLKTYADETNISTDTLASMDVTHYANNDNAEVVGDLQSQILNLDVNDIEAELNSKYTKPSTGIPASDLASGVIPTSLPASNTTDTYSSTGTAPVSGKAVASAISNKADKATTLAGYGITDSVVIFSNDTTYEVVS